MYKFKKWETKIFEIEDALKMRNINTYECQRPFKMDWMRELSQRIIDGRFRIGNIAVAVKKYDNNARIEVNGQHQSEAVILCGKPIKVLYEEWDVFSPEDLSKLYRTFDTHAGRTLRDLARAEAGALDIQWPPHLLSLLITSAALREGKYHESKDAKVELLKKYIKFGDLMASILAVDGKKSNGHRHMNRGAVGYAMILTWEKSIEDSKKFWISVRDGENLRKDNPELKLRNYLMNVTVGVGRGAQHSITRVVPTHEMTYKCIQAWNAFRKNEPTDLKYYLGKPIPKVI